MQDLVDRLTRAEDSGGTAPGASLTSRQRIRLSELEKEIENPGVWDDQAAARSTMKELSELRDEVAVVAGLPRPPGGPAGTGAPG